MTTTYAATASKIPVSDTPYKTRRSIAETTHVSDYDDALACPLAMPTNFFPSFCFLYLLFIELLSQLPLSFFNFANLLTNGTAFTGTDKLGVRSSLANRQLHQLVNPFTPRHPQASYVCVDSYCDMLTPI